MRSGIFYYYLLLNEDRFTLSDMNFNGVAQQMKDQFKLSKAKDLVEQHNTPLYNWV
jgi:hypothetical protein